MDETTLLSALCSEVLASQRQWRSTLATAPGTTVASSFLLLPGELREAVYDCYFTHDPTIPTPHISRSALALPLTCRQLYGETHARAFLATTFTASCWHLWELKARFSSMPLQLRPYVKRLEITIHVSDFLEQPSSLNGLRFAAAGLTGLKELYIQYTGQPKSEKGETYILSNLELVLWKTVVKGRNERLEKIRLVHNGTLRQINIAQLCERMQSWLPLPWASDETWQIHRDFEQGRYYLLKRATDGSTLRNVCILLGYTIREAESYHTVREELLKGKVLEGIRARRTDGKDATDLDDEALAFEVEQLCRDFRLTDIIDPTSYY